MIVMAEERAELYAVSRAGDLIGPGIRNRWQVGAGAKFHQDVITDRETRHGRAVQIVRKQRALQERSDALGAGGGPRTRPGQ